jgi:PAS domain S-box-containing protein
MHATAATAMPVATARLRRAGRRARQHGSRRACVVDMKPSVAGMKKAAAQASRVEQVLRESEERFRLAFEGAPIGMALVGLDGRFLRVNRALCSLVGYTAEELTALTFHQITHPDDVDIDDALAHKLERGEIPSCQLAKRYLRKDGSVVDVMLHGSIARNSEGEPLYFVAQVEDISVRLHAEAALRRSEAQLRELIQQAPEPVFVADLEGRYVDVNRAAERLLGYERAELLEMSVGDVIVPEDTNRLSAAREQLAQEGAAPQVAEWMLRRKDGVVLPVEVSAKIYPDGRWVAFARDMSERKRTEDALRRSEQSLARAQRVAGLGSWEWDLRSNEVWRSNELFNLFGLSPGAISPRVWSLTPYFHPDDRQRIRHVVEEAIRDGKPYSLEHRIIRADGVERIVVQQGEPILAHGTTIRTVGTILDVTEQRQAQQEREATLTWLKAVFEHSPVALMLVHGQAGRTVELNSAAKALIGRPLTRIGEFSDMLLDAAGVEVSYESLPSRRALRGERIEGVDLLLERPDGARIPVLAASGPIRDAAGSVTGAVVAFQDVSAAKELDRLRAEWGSVVAHDLRQPLHTISSYAQFIERKKVVDQDTRESAARIRAAGSRLNRMIGDLMDLSRLDARRLELSCQRLNLADLVAEAIERFRLEAPERAVDMRVAGELRPVSADPDRMAQVFDNLLSNALKYSTPNSPVEVAVRGGERDVTIAVTNEGRGIAPDEIPLLFQRFQRAADAKRAKIKGIGLGLYITRELVEAHGGQLTVESVPGAKTTFRFTLPCAA